MPENFDKDPDEIEMNEDPRGLEVYLKLLSQLFNKFGVTKSLQDETNASYILTIACLNYGITGDRNLLNSINVYEKKLTDIKKRSTGVEISFSKELGIVSKEFGSLIDPRKTSMYLYHAAKSNINNG